MFRLAGSLWTVTAIDATVDTRVEARGRGRLVIIMLAVIVALGAGAAGLRLLSTPRSLVYGQSATGTTAAIGEVDLIGMGSSSRDIVVRDAVPLVSAGSASAAVSVLVCHSVTPFVSIGAVKGWASLAQYCTKVVPASGAHVEAQKRGSTFDYFVLTVVPLAPGPIVIDGIRVRHSGGWRDTTERTGSIVTVNPAGN